MTAKRFLTEDDKTVLEKDVAAANTAASNAASVAKGASATAQEAIDLARAGTNIRTYTNLEQIGMSSNDFSSSDFKANIVKLADYFDGKNFLFQMFIEKGNPASWYNSISSKLSNDLSVTLGAADNLQVFIRGMMSDSTDTGVILIDVVSDGYASNGVVFSCSFTRSLLGDDVSKFIYTQHAPRKFSVNLASETEGVYNGSSDVSMGVSGMLPLSHGGTGGHTAEIARRNLGITPDNIGAVPTTRKVNNKALSSDISLSAEDVGAASAAKNNIVVHMNTLNDLSFVENDFNYNMKLLSDYMDELSGNELWEWRYPMATSSNLTKSILAKLQADLGCTISSYLDVVCQKYNISYTRVFIYPQTKTWRNYVFYTTFAQTSAGELGSMPFQIMTCPDTISQTDITEGVTPLLNGEKYFVYE